MPRATPARALLRPEVPLRFLTSDWHGAPTSLRPTCPGCPYFVAGREALRLKRRVQFPKRNRAAVATATAFCIWGVAVKALVEPVLARRCELPGKPSPGAEVWRRLLVNWSPETTRLPPSTPTPQDTPHA